MKQRDSGDKNAECLSSLLAGKGILHLGNLAGWPFTLAKQMRRQDVVCENVIHEYRDVEGLDRKLPRDRAIFAKNDGMLTKVFKTFWFLLTAPAKYKIIHYHSCNILPRELLFLEAAFLKICGVKTVISFGGGDARVIREARKKNPFFYKKPSFIRDLIIRWRWVNWNICVDACAADPEMLNASDNKIRKKVRLMQPIDFDRLKRQRQQILNRPIRIMHVPTEPVVKGTENFRTAIESLKAEFDFEYVEEFNLSQSEFYQLLSTTDIYLDELKCGGYGVTAAEAMSMGKLVVTYIREDLVLKYPSQLPLLNANPNTISAVLRRILKDEADLITMKESCFDYASRHHDSEVIVSSVLFPLYRELLS